MTVTQTETAVAKLKINQLTKAQYETIQNPSDTELYFITDEVSNYVDSTLSNSSENPVQNKVIYTALEGKQATLVSGTNIKTINSTSLLGSGDISIPSPNNSTITFTQGGVTKGTITTNQSSNSTVSLDSATQVTFRTWS